MLALGANGRGRAGLLSALRPQDVFATSLYTGTGGSTDNRIVNGLDLLGKGGLVWNKYRDAAVAYDHVLTDTVRGRDYSLATNNTAAETTPGGLGSGGSLAFNSDGFTPSANANVNRNTYRYAAWSFRRASKFFDIVTYTGDGTSGRVIPHALGIKPGMIIVKARSSAFSWPVYHRSLGANNLLFLNLTDAATASALIPAEPTDTGFVVGIGGGNATNQNGVTYVAYLFAHDPDTTNGIVQCGSFTGDQTISLGWTPQFLIFKGTDTVSSWLMLDATRGWTGATDPLLLANTSGAEANNTNYITPTATGFTMANIAGGGSGVYLAIRAPI